MNKYEEMSNMTNEEKEKIIFDKVYEKRPKCKNCFCNDLCMFLILRTGVATSCEDFQRRVRIVVDREKNK